ncbi:MAG: hypothetical protein ABSE62_06335 [Chthoniobacteraceae bacterium]|jgi:hypothetical protein
MEKEAEPGPDRIGIKAHCSHCRCERLFVHARLEVRRHLIITILTTGLWLPVWAALFFSKSLRPWRCGVCQWHKPEFRNPPSPFQPEAAAHTPEKVQPPTVERP